MSKRYGLEQYGELLLKNFQHLKDPMSAPFGSDPFSVEQTNIRHAKMESINYALEMLPEPDPDAERYRKLRAWMSANVDESWDEVCKLATVGVYVGWDEFDSYLDRLPECNVGLCERVSNQ